MEFFAVQVSILDDSYDCWIHQDTLYPTRESAKKAIVLLRAEALVKEQEDWDANPCECGKRDCDYRLHLFPNFSIQVLKLAS